MWFTLLLLGTASAGTECLTVDAFNAAMASRPATTTATVRFDLTGVNPNDFAGGKGALVDLTHLGCAAGGSLALKVYGPDDPPNLAHPPGTLKHEHGYGCGPLPAVETWADPNPSETVFVDGTERCDATVWIDPLTFGYRLDCDHGTFEAIGDNAHGMPVDHVTLFALTDPDTWHIDNAVSTWNEVCFETDDVGETGDTGTTATEQTLELGAIEDVTVAVDHPTDVYPDVHDLCVEAGHCATYLKFDLSDVRGTVVSATLFLGAGDDPSSEGSGADLFPVPDTGWSATTLTWDTRPAAAGAPIGRVGPIVSGADYAIDLTGAIAGGAPIALALWPADTDTNGAHFASSEASATRGPRLALTWIPATEDAGNDPEGGALPDDPSDPTAAPLGQPAGCGCGSPAAPTGLAGWLAAIAAIGLRRRHPAR